MNNRYLSLDFLRGLTIFGMVFCAIIPHGVLPAWMYHIQNPPPLHNLDMSIAGLSWVDMVFPIFIFCMGAAIPLSGRAKIAGGITTKRYLFESFKRFLMLWLFSYLYVLLNFMRTTSQSGDQHDIHYASALTIAGSLALFPLYTIFKNRSKRFTTVMRVLGVVLCCSIIAVGHIYFNQAINVQRRGIIIFLLAFLYLFGSIIWYFTRDCIRSRAIIFIALIIGAVITINLNVPSITYADPNIRWWFNIEYFYFLILLLPATFIGDLLQRQISENPNLYKRINGKYAHLFYPATLLLTAYIIFGVYMRYYWSTIVLSGVALLLLWGMVKREFCQYKEMFLTAILLIMSGLILDPLNGGLKKVPCTIQYCLLTCGLSILLLIFSDYVCRYIGKSLLVKTFAGAGKNPLMSYIAFDSFVVPFMQLSGLIVIYKGMYPDGIIFLGILRSAIIVFATMWLVSLISKRSIFWKA